MPKTTWTGVRIAEIRTLAITMSSSEIACKVGVPKNAVIGICRRQKIPLTAYAERPHPYHDRPKPKPRPIVLCKGVIPNTDNKPLPIEQIVPVRSLDWPPASGKCGYLIGEPKELKCCGWALTGLGYYCEAHRLVCYVPIVRKPPKMYDCGERR